MDKRQAQQMQREMAGAINLLAHPVAGAAALSALGFGLASHVWGAWLGALSATAQASQRLLDPDTQPAQAERGAESPQATVKKARVVPKTLIAQAHSTTGGAGDRAGKRHDARAVAVAGGKNARRPAAIERPQAPADLKAIPGIGPKLEQVLNGLGVWSYAQIAGWSEQEVAWVDDHLGFTGRIVRDDWIGQAAALARVETKN